jgi:ribosomal protein S18 acetylase RimI-like enzyme
VADLELAWRVEQACFHAWPALEEVRVGDWVARAGRGLTRRNSSANPLSPDARLTDVAIEACAELYRGWGLPAIFRLPSFLDPAADRRLEQLGYALDEPVLTVFAERDRLATAADPGVEIRPAPDADWLAARAALNGYTAKDAVTFAQVVERLCVPAAFAALRVDGQVASLAFVARHQDLLCVESVATDERMRGRGLARRMLAALLAAPLGQSCRGICLQVRADNAPAIALYRALGLSREVYRYNYRRTALP